ncbi:MAG: DUF4401 domain-containing protein [Chitinophagaceae bacterium]|nr:DUF4401 domain-containing protein [Chitinophagaceae bacterium]
MKKQPEINDVMELFRAREGASLTLDEPAILREYEHANANRSGIAIKVLTVIGGFLVTCAFLGFLFIAGIYHSGLGMMVSGCIFVVGALIVKKVFDLLILDTFAVSFYICGCLLIFLGLMEYNLPQTPVCCVFIIISLLSLLFIQNYMMAFVATCIFHAAAFALFQGSSPYSGYPHIYIALLIWFFTFWVLEEAGLTRWSNKLSKLYNPIRMASLLAILIICYLTGTGWFLRTYYNSWFIPLAAVSSILFLLPRILAVLEIQQPGGKIFAYAATILALVPTFWGPSIAASLLVILLCFYANFKTGIVAGIIALIWFACDYYYNLQLTLLTKSLLMMATGFFFLLLYFLTHKKLNSK